MSTLLTLHPLAKYPGPLIAKITDWYSVYHAWKGDRHLEFWRCHEKYGWWNLRGLAGDQLIASGPFVRFGPNSLSINTNTALKDVYGFKANVRKGDFYSVFPPTKDTFNTHSSIDKASHAHKRRVLSQAFSDQAQRSMEHYILANVRAFCAALVDRSSGSPKTQEKSQKDWSSPRNMTDWCSYLTFDVLGDLSFGKSFEMLGKDDNRFVVDLVNHAAHRHLICGTLPLIHEYHLDKVLFQHIASGRMKYIAYSKSRAAERAKLGTDTDRKDFFYYLLNAKDPETGQGFSPSELWGESNLLIIAGSDTTATALGATMFYLTHNTRTLSKLNQEIRNAFTDVEEICSGPTLQSCTYLRACVDEALRLSPPVGGLLPRQVLAGGMEADGHHIPEDTVIGTPHYALHHNPAYYPDPFEYKPERWFSDPAGGITEDQVAMAHSAFCPFSIGPRGCIGKGMAYVELLTTIGRLSFLYDMQLAPGKQVGEGRLDLEWGRQRKGEFQLQDIFTSRRDGPLIQFRERDW
ncbi:MAG: hypothetical protein Q9190_001583 [Brigantiaea leucoxantha]